MTNRDELRAHLFSRPDRRLLNIKITRGDATVISPDDIYEQLCSIFRQHDAGLQPVGPVRSSRPKVNVREWVATL